MSEPVLLTIDGGVAEVRFNRPESLNAIDVPTAVAFRAAVGKAVASAEVRAILITAAGRAFMAGGDLAYFRDAENRPAAASQIIGPMHEALAQLAEIGLPVVAAVQGSATGAGMSIALSADYVIAADDASFNLAYLKLGAVPDCGGSWILPRLVGLHCAFEIAVLSDTLTASRALELRLVNRLVPEANLREAASKVAARLAAGPTEAIARTKALLRQASRTSYAEQLQAEAAGFQAAAGTSDFSEGLQAFFEKRRPRFGA